MTPTQKFTNDNGMYSDNKEERLFNKTKQMIDQKNHMDLPITELHPPENEIDFELLWRCISKIWRTNRRTCLRGGILNCEQ